MSGTTLPPGAIAKSIRTSLERVLADALPPDKTVALLAVVDDDGTRLVAAARAGDRWTFAAELDRPWDGDLRGSVAVRAAW